MMLRYNVRLALTSLRRNPILTALLITAIALGVCVSTTFVALRHILSKDPVPGKSSHLFYVRLDSWDPQSAWASNDPNSLPSQVTWKDMQALMHSTIPARQSGSFISQFFIFPDSGARPFSANARCVVSDFFSMFQVPFRYGGPWDRSADARAEHVIVIDEATNNRLFKGTNSVGQSVRMGDQRFRVVGVLAPWRPNVHYYDLTQNFYAPPEPIFIPISLTEPLKLGTNGDSDGWSPAPINTFADFLNSEQVWLQMWVELPTPEKEAAYRDLLRNYINDQKKLGRFQRPLHFELTPMPKLLVELQVVPKVVRSMSIVSVLFLIVCSLNLVGLLLGKFLARIPEVSVRRALGASRVQVFLQHIVECEVVGTVGGAVGVALSVLLLRGVGRYMPQGMALDLDAAMLGTALFLSLGAGLLAGIYPAWRVCATPPAMQLKIQ